MSMFKINLRELAKKPNLLLPGHRLCAGCGAPIVVKQVLMATRGPTIVVNATGCLEVATTVSYTHLTLPTTPYV